MARHKVRCPFEVQGGNGDRCRRFKGHEDQSITHERWHFPDCGSAVASDGQWVVDEHWKIMFHEVEDVGEILA